MLLIGEFATTIANTAANANTIPAAISCAKNFLNWLNTIIRLKLFLIPFFIYEI
jgi:hypothetical protein